MNNMAPLMGQLQKAMQNPAAFASQCLGRSVSDPNEVIQQLMNTGRLTQAQYNRALRTRFLIYQKGRCE